jgi:hypothetical protein
MKARFRVNGSEMVLPCAMSADARKVTVQVRLPAKCGSETLAVELNRADLLGALELIDLEHLYVPPVPTPGDALGVMDELVRKLESRKG